MRINEYRTLKEFTSQYIGEWNPSAGHWFGLNFSYQGNEYRLHTGAMYDTDNIFLSDGREVLFSLYLKNSINKQLNYKPAEYTLLGQYAAMDELLKSTAICGTPFQEIIMNDSTELLGQD